MKEVREIMTKDPICCTPDINLQEVAKLMVECDCGEIPILNNEREKHVIGVVTDRDICCRAVAQGKNPLELAAKDCMSTPAVTINFRASVEECINLMERKLIRRIPVVDDDGAICGMVSQADIAEKLNDSKTGEVIKVISRHTEDPSSLNS